MLLFGWGFLWQFNVLNEIRFTNISLSLQHSSGFKKAEDDAAKEAEEKLKEIQAAGKKQGDKVVEDLIKATTDVKPQVPEKIISRA